MGGQRDRPERDDIWVTVREGSLLRSSSQKCIEKVRKEQDFMPTLELTLLRSMPGKAGGRTAPQLLAQHMLSDRMEMTSA